jgi:hypothetical protein
MGCGEASWDALPRSPSDGREARRGAGLRSSPLSARGTLGTQASTWPRPSGTQHRGTAGGSPPLVWQLGRCRHGTTSAVTPATYDSHVTRRPCPIRESSHSPEGDVRQR